MSIRTRFAPSPTGYMHIGNLRTALYTYLIAKNAGGEFILRIEDTDRNREVEGATDIIYNSLKKCGLNWDEGPDKGGDFGPYIQSARKEIYLEYAKKLVDLGFAYYCFCSKERLESLREKAQENNLVFKYDRKCYNLSKEEIDEKLKNGDEYVIRQKMPDKGATTYIDTVFGKITIDNRELEDQILLKADGWATYNFANVIDDHLMGITHVVRGNEYLAQTPKYNLLYEAFGWDTPQYVHVSPIMKDEQNKLSKRNGDASFEDLIAKGYLKNAIINYIALLGWSSGDDREFFTLDELIKEFSIKRINKSPSIFDIVKLKWMNSEYVNKLSGEEFYEYALPYIKEVVKSNVDLKKVSQLIQSRTEIFSEIPESIDFIDVLPEYSPELYIHAKMKTTYENSLLSLEKIYEKIESMEVWDEEILGQHMTNLAKELNVKNGVVFWPIRTAVSGKQFTPGGAKEIAFILGKEESIRRIKIGIELLKNTI